MPLHRWRKSIADVYLDYVHQYTNPPGGHEGPFGNYVMYHRIFTQKFNIVFFILKKDQCELCQAFRTAEVAGEDLKEKYENCIIVKDLSCIVKISELTEDSASCYIWHEEEGNHGSSEIRVCMLKFVEEKMFSTESDIEIVIVFYSDTCCRQPKKKFTISMYIYAVLKYPGKTVTHKFLIKGHSKHEGANVHSMIAKRGKKSLNTRSIYHRSHHDDVFDLKELSSDIGSNFKKNTDNKVVKRDKGAIKYLSKEELKAGHYHSLDAITEQTHQVQPFSGRPGLIEVYVRSLIVMREL
ncbi:hypothetical protein PR048_020510 [Dryococelus australis]|uniref:Uncharacterized protein n=1 Tax=Dryococelus australis TaxID=614101 RepID=A0ABQ9H6G6_9NEOP|nr:hypothetical protein PR048_020510 [Dryococelus australis]